MEVMGKLVAMILMLVGFAGNVIPEGALILGCSPNASAQNTPSISNDSAVIMNAVSSFDAFKTSSHHDDCDGCGNPSDACHHCHFGHHGFVANINKFSLFQVDSQYGKFNQNFHLKSFIDTLFRPPIA